jgi:hypothetical protein
MQGRSILNTTTEHGYMQIRVHACIHQVCMVTGESPIWRANRAQSGLISCTF